MQFFQIVRVSMIGALFIPLMACQSAMEVTTFGSAEAHAVGSCNPRFVDVAEAWAAAATELGSGPKYQRTDAQATASNGNMRCSVRAVGGSGTPIRSQRQQRPQGERRQHREGDDGYHEEREYHDRGERSGGQGVLRRNYEDPRNYARQHPRRPY